MRIAAVIGNFLVLILVSFLIFSAGLPGDDAGKFFVGTTFLSALISLAVLSSRDSARVSDLKRQVKEAELEKKLEELRKS